MSVNSGFTMLELMIALSIGAILATIAVPSYQSMMVQSRLATQTNELLTALHFSRSEAVKRGMRVTICKSSSGTTCTAGSSWQDGWIVYSDSGTAGTIDGSDQILRVFPALKGSTMDGGTKFANWIAYLANGSSRGSSGNGNLVGTGTFILCNSTKGRKITINHTGRPYTETISSC
ncbi:GspH/FimT family pseudopilin [Nitrosomonas sp. Nm33]|uniref:GspH/FimT family pseudopilin n=1 Tax=Nitrosomonas sp. Nm33 TaxID=133724 RepID=UPI00089B2CDF|nr:GspH/FimT family pseudopilin [Nitrosomonas sp. Nm33]SDY37784.1 type IV fimbrial biogenesis protein FimT [Nitrosomonas sp. Nm33]